MSDFGKNPENFDKYGNPLPGVVPGTPYEAVDSGGRAPYVLLGILVLIGIIGGALYFNGTPNGSRHGADVATAPLGASGTIPAPNATRTAPALPPAGRSMDATPAPSSTDATKQ